MRGHSRPGGSTEGDAETPVIESVKAVVIKSEWVNKHDRTPGPRCRQRL